MWLVALAACERDGSGDDTGPPPFAPSEHEIVEAGMLTVETWSDRSSIDGTLDVVVDVTDETSFQVTLASDQEWPVLEQIVDPDGNVVLDAADWLSSDLSLTGAFDRSRKTTAAGWPVRDEDGELFPGAWTVRFATVEDPRVPVPEVDVNVAIHRKVDPDLRQGQLNLRIVWADGIDADLANVTAVETALDTVRSIFGQIGIEVVETYHSSTLDPQLGFTDAVPDSAVGEVAEEVTEPGDLMVVVGEEFGFYPILYGRSAGTPGSLMPTRYQWVAIALRAHGGSDGVVSTWEAEFMGNALTHELGHYMGLSHPVETTWDRWDAIADTPLCVAQDPCEHALQENLMFPYSQCTGDVCGSNADITLGQEGVLHRFAGVL